MKIWFDLSNSPHINMFYDLIKELENEGHEIIITSRPLANTIQLLEQKGLKHKVIGNHYGKNILKKIFGFPIRIIQLNNYLKTKQINLAISQSSFHSPIVAWLLNIPSIYTNDNEHAIGNKPAFHFATKILIPENLFKQSLYKNKKIINKIIQYPGIKEGIYLWKSGEKINLKRAENLSSIKKIYFRPEPPTAQYYNGKLNFMDETILALQKKYQIVILPRDKNQNNHYKNKKFNLITVADKPISFFDIATDCLLFIGAGGSMTRELAILGIPTISVYQGKLLEVDEILISKGMMIHEPILSEQKIHSIVHNLQNKEPSVELIKNGKQAYNLFKKQILSYNK